MQSPEHDSSANRRKKSTGVFRSILFLILLGFAVHLLLPQITQLEKSLQVLKDMHLWAVGLAICAQILSYWGSGILLQAVVALTLVHISLLISVLISLAAASIGLIAGGIVGSSAGVFNWMRVISDKSQSAMLASTLPPFINILSLIIVSIFGLIHLLLIHELTGLQTLSIALFGLITIIVLFAVVWGVRHRERTILLVETNANKLSAVFHTHYESSSVSAYLKNLFSAWDVLIDAGWQKTAFGAILNVFFDMLTLYFLFVAAGNTVSAGVLLVGYGIPLLLGKMAFVIPGGVGVVEASMVGLYTGLGVPESIAVVVVLVYRVISFWMPTILGFPVAAYLQAAATRNQH